MMKKIRKSVILCIFVFVMSMFISLVPTHASKVIKVGCVDLENFLVIQDGIVSGYGAEFLDEIAKYTSWRYEYVKGTWEECLKWLEEGKIDLLLPAQYSAERKVFI